MSRFLEALHSGRVLLMDGAMGTELQRAGLAEGERGEHWNFQHPERVRAIHENYVDAGAQVLLTNTFQAISACVGWRSQPPAQARRLDEAHALLAVQWAATALCRAASGPERFILANLGSYGDSTANQEFSDFTLLKHAGQTLAPVDGVLLETCSTPRVATAVARLRAVRPELPILLSMTFLKDGDGIRTIGGLLPEWFAERAEAWGVAALGVNCGRDLDMDAIAEVIRRYRSATSLPLFARPNAGTPRRVGKRWVYPLTPKAMAHKLPALLEAGVAMVGGCCGTTPAHIAALRPVIGAWNKRVS
jgi:5-methyltetrahydrofolate--homocysteine methyltransferase